MTPLNFRCKQFSEFLVIQNLLEMTFWTRIFVLEIPRWLHIVCTTIEIVKKRRFLPWGGGGVITRKEGVKLGNSTKMLSTSGLPSNYHMIFLDQFQLFRISMKTFDLTTRPWFQPFNQYFTAKSCIFHIFWNSEVNRLSIDILCSPTNSIYLIFARFFTQQISDDI